MRGEQPMNGDSARKRFEKEQVKKRTARGISPSRRKGKKKKKEKETPLRESPRKGQPGGGSWLHIL